MRYMFTIGLDKLGMTASTLCAIHCAAVPLLFTFLPLWGLSFLAEEWVELSMIGLAIVLGSLSLGLSYRKHHRRMMPVILLLLGFGLIMAGHLSPYENLEAVIIPAGGFTIAAAHLLNWRYTMRCPYHKNEN